MRRELGLRDTTLFAIATLCSARWISAAAHAGPGSILLWLLAGVFLAAPVASAVAALSAKYPGAGGLYLWTRSDFGPWHGFLCFWIYFLAVAVWFPSTALAYVSLATSALAPGRPHLVDNRVFLVTVSLAAIWIALGTNLIGMKIGKWTENAGGIAVWATAALLATVAVLVYARRGSATTFHLLPEWDWQTVAFWSSIAYAFTGLEGVPTMGAEIRDPARTLRRGGWIASGFTVVFYTGLTAAVLALLPPARISEVHGVAQAGQEAGTELGCWWIAPLVGVLLIASAIGQFGALGTSTARMPFAVGVDHLLAPAFSRIHPRWGTPHISLLIFGAIASFLLVAAQLGETGRAAYQELISLMVITGFLPYLYMFSSAWKAGRRLSAVSGIMVTVLAIACAVVPTAEVRNVPLYELKLLGGTAAVITSAWMLYRRALRRMAKAEVIISC